MIELLVVIAIIGILSSVVLASLNTARNKGADAAIKSNVDSARAQAELYYDSGATNTYAGVCAAASTANPGGILTMEQGAIAAGSGTVVCGDTATAWAISAQLKVDNTKYWCVDSTGKTGTQTGATITDGAGSADTTCG